MPPCVVAWVDAQGLWQTLVEDRPRNTHAHVRMVLLLHCMWSGKSCVFGQLGSFISLFRGTFGSVAV
eukprot:1970070-Amphidinium_carterae.1